MGLTPVAVVRLRYIHQYTDRHGHVRHYLRRPGAPKVALPGESGTPEFMAAYQAAIAIPAEKKAPTPRAAAGTIAALTISYRASAEFRQLRASTATVYQRIIDRLVAAHGDKPVRLLEPRHIRSMLAAMADTPAAGNHWLRTMRGLMRHAVAEGLIPADPTRDVSRLKERRQSIHTWTDAEIAAYEARWQVGTKHRLALALLLYTGQRRSDVVRMGRQHMTGGAILVRQVKTGTELAIPIHPALQAAIDACPSDHLTLLTTEAGAPFTSNGFYQAFIGWCRMAGLPAGCSPHGLRSAAASRLAEEGCTEKQIAAITGHQTLAEVQRYTRAASQRRLAETAMAGYRRGKPGTGIG